MSNLATGAYIQEGTLQVLQLAAHVICMLMCCVTCRVGACVAAPVLSLHAVCQVRVCGCCPLRSAPPDLYPSGDVLMELGPVAPDMDMHLRALATWC